MRAAQKFVLRGVAGARPLAISARNVAQSSSRAGAGRLLSTVSGAPAAVQRGTDANRQGAARRGPATVVDRTPDPTAFLDARAPSAADSQIHIDSKRILVPWPDGQKSSLCVLRGCDLRPSQADIRGAVTICGSGTSHTGRRG